MTTTNATTSTPPVYDDAVRPDWLYRTALVLSVIGILLTSYLVYSHYADAELYCADTGSLDCNAVQSSFYSQLMGIPVALLGLGAYATIFLLLVTEPYIGLVAQYGRVIVFGMTLFGFMYSGYLTYIEAFVIHKWCQYCIISALLMTALFVIALLRVLNAPVYEEDEA